MTGGNDGTVTLYNLGDCLLELKQNSNGNNGANITKTENEECCLQSTFLVPDDRPLVVSKRAIDFTAEIEQHACTPPLEVFRKTKKTKPAKVFQRSPT